MSILRLKACTRLLLNQNQKKNISFDSKFNYVYDDKNMIPRKTPVKVYSNLNILHNI